MKKYLLIILAFLLLTGCSSDSEDGIKVSSPSVYEGEDYQEVLTDLENAGFTNIKLEILDDLITGWLTKDGEIESISINGDIDYDSGVRYPSDTEIIIIYHTFPIEDEVDDENETNSNDDSVADSSESDDDIIIDENITILNNEDFAECLLCGNNADSKIIDFVNAHKGDIIEFDANIAYLNNHGEYTTRYDILIYSGDYSETTAYGPSFQFNDVNTTDLGISDLYLPEYISIGENVHVIAKIESFDETSLLLKLDPIEVTPR